MKLFDIINKTRIWENNMGLFQRIKNIFKKTKALPAPEENMYEEKSNKNNSWMFYNNNGSYYQPTKLENDIDRFLKAYYTRISMYPEGTQLNNYAEAYSALVGMNGTPITQEEFNNNYYKENELLQQLYSENKYTVQVQENNSGLGNEFYHIKSQGYKLPNEGEMIRVYLNCNTGNTAELAKTLLENNTNENFYLKFCANNPTHTMSRGEKIVIYCENSDYDYTLSLIEYAKQIRPDLFVESEKNLPFLQSVNNIASVAYQPKSNQYQNLNSQMKTIPKSVNAFMTSMLEESYIASAREIAKADSNLNFLLSPEYFNDETLYIKNYPYIDDRYHEYLLKSMQAKMEVLSRKNGIYVDGIDYNNQQRKQEIMNEITK